MLGCQYVETLPVATKSVPLCGRDFALCSVLVLLANYCWPEIVRHTEGLCFDAL